MRRVCSSSGIVALLYVPGVAEETLANLARAKQRVHFQQSSVKNISKARRVYLDVEALHALSCKVQ